MSDFKKILTAIFAIWFLLVCLIYWALSSVDWAKEIGRTAGEVSKSYKEAISDD